MPDSSDFLITRSSIDTITNKTLLNPTISTITATGGAVLSLPSGTGADTLVGRVTTDTLINKTLLNPTISTITATGGAVLSLPSGTASDTLVGRATTDTLTNKTLIGSTNNVQANLIGSNPVAVTGIPQAGYVLTAVSATGAVWQAEIPCIVGSMSTTGTTSTPLLALQTADNTNYIITSTIVAKQTSTGTTGTSQLGAIYSTVINSAYRRLTGASSLVQIQSDSTTTFKDPTVNWSAGSTGSTSTGLITVQCVGSAGTSINWSGNCQYVNI